MLGIEAEDDVLQLSRWIATCQDLEITVEQAVSFTVF
jgi:hypothetical protein